ncbi:MAG: acetylornithine transaminase [Rhodospirillales bacterium RIFCSPLOWO2_12_FULL_58_28]|nr:MAG: acetylornithine transaminase [Rhodospirillales bacterium RIFCSPLOWO2_02_FULL_58_16]OHC77733.1 MAG: acetylornithine transaminase [Rhodospirillales bacterium RIFCSPLOWO2_12_FULL_58_28]
MQTYARSDLAFERGDGAYLYTADGRKFLDFASGVAVNALGHCHPKLVKALTAQAGKLWHCSNLYQIPEGERLAKRLCEATFADSAFFANSGSEAVECGLKMVRKYFDENGEPDRYRVIACEGAFHGRTLTTIAAGGQQKHLAGFDPVADGFDRVPFADLDATRAAIGPETAAILVEPVQGEGGIKPAPPEYLKGLRKIADDSGLLLFFDEVQCGMGRTGKLFAHEWAGATPDIMALAKGIGAGFPMSACLAVGKVASALGVGSHGSTYGGNPLAMAVGNAVLDVMLADGFLDGVNAVAGMLWRRLNELRAKHPDVLVDVRGVGLMIGLECQKGVDNAALKARLQNNGLLTVGAGGNVVRLLPPLIIDRSHIDEAVAVIDKSCAEMKEKPL